MTSPPPWLVDVAAGVIGLVVGSFLNVVIFRVPRGLSIVRPRSFCPACGSTLRAIDNIPVLSWLLLGRRCHACREPIPPRYLLVEVGVAASFVAVAMAAGPHWAVPGLCALAATLAAVTAIEIDGRTPPRSIAYGGSAIGALLLLGAAVSDRQLWRLAGAGLGVAVVVVADLVRTDRRGPCVRHRGAGQCVWAAVPAAAACGWLGPAAAVTGVVMLAVLLLAGAGTTPQSGHGRNRRLSVSHIGFATSVAIASVAATCVAAGLGVSFGR